MSAKVRGTVGHRSVLGAFGQTASAERRVKRHINARGNTEATGRQTSVRNESSMHDEQTLFFRAIHSASLNVSLPRSLRRLTPRRYAADGEPDRDFQSTITHFKTTTIQPRGEPTVCISASLDGTEGLAFPSDNRGSRSALKPGRVAARHQSA